MSKTKVTLACEICRNKNYRVAKSSENRLIINKFCPTCKIHTEHREEK